MINHPTPDLFTGRVMRIAPTWAVGEALWVGTLPLDIDEWEQVQTPTRGDTCDRYDAYCEAWWRRERRWFHQHLALEAIDPCTWDAWKAEGSQPLDFCDWVEVWD